MNEQVEKQTKEEKKEWYVEDFYFYDTIRDAESVKIQNMSGYFFGETELAFTAFSANACDFLKRKNITWKTTNPYMKDGKIARLIINDPDYGEIDYGIKQIVITQKDIELKLKFSNETFEMKL